MKISKLQHAKFLSISKWAENNYNDKVDGVDVDDKDLVPIIPVAEWTRIQESNESDEGSHRRNRNNLLNRVRQVHHAKWRCNRGEHLWVPNHKFEGLTASVKYLGYERGRSRITLRWELHRTKGVCIDNFFDGLIVETGMNATEEVLKNRGMSARFAVSFGKQGTSHHARFESV